MSSSVRTTARSVDELWQREQRICSDTYFARYFHYGIPPRDVPDQAIQEVVAAAERSVESAAELIATYCRKGAASILVRKLRARARTIPAESAKPLVLAVARSGTAFPKEQSMYSFVASTFAQAAILAVNLISRIPAGVERENIATEVIGTAEPLPFAIECFKWLRGDQKDPDRALPAEFEDRLGKIIANRIEADVERPPYEACPEDAGAVFSIWKHYGIEGAVGRYLEGRFSRYPHEIIALLNAYTPTGWGLESGLSHKGDFMQESYHAVAQLVSPDLIMRHLRELYGAVDTAEFHQSDEVELGERLARQFGFLHRKAQELSRGASETPAGEQGSVNAEPQVEAAPGEDASKEDAT